MKVYMSQQTSHRQAFAATFAGASKPERRPIPNPGTTTPNLPMPPPIPATLKSLVFPPSRHHPPPPLLLIYGKKQNRAINYSRCRPTRTLLLTKAAGESSSKIWWARPRSTPHEAEGLLRIWAGGWAGERQSGGGNNVEGDSLRTGATGSLQQPQSDEGKAGLNGGDKERDQKDGLLTLPTILTLGRVAAVPLIVSTFYMTGWWASTATTGIFVAAAITDWLDGYIARKMRLRTTFGAFLDPVADKLMVATTLVLLCNNPLEVAVFGEVPWLLTVPSIVIIGREMTMSAVREWAASQDTRALEAVAVSNMGKWKTATQMTALTILLASRDTSLAGSNILVPSGVVLLYISAGLALLSLVVYMRKIWRILLN